MAKINIKTFKEACRNTGGNQARIAEKLEVTRSAVNHFLSKHPNMRELLNQEAEFVIDVAEDNINKSIMAGDVDVSEWALVNRKRGKERGYGQKQEVEHSGSTSATFNLITKSVEEIKDAKDRSARARLGDKPEARGNTESS